jgi:hypothetical protein
MSYLTLEVEIDHGRVIPSEPGQLPASGKGLLTILPAAGGNTSEPSAPLTLRESAEMRGKLAAWEEDWNAPGMEAYDRP